MIAVVRSTRNLRRPPWLQAATSVIDQAKIGAEQPCRHRFCWRLSQCWQLYDQQGWAGWKVGCLFRILGVVPAD